MNNDKKQNIKELCDQQTIYFANGWSHCIASNRSGKVYYWGCNTKEFLGIGSKGYIFPKPILNEYLNNQFVIDFSCGAFQSLVLTNCGEGYVLDLNGQGQTGYDCNNNQLIPIKVKGFN
jgi:alpha-tubulin suppressor-like RCC1 family protein